MTSPVPPPLSFVHYVHDLERRIRDLETTRPPSIPVMFASTTSDKSVPDSTLTALPWVATVDSESGMTGGVYTIPRAGIYRCYSRVYAGTASGGLFVRISQNGANVNSSHGTFVGPTSLSVEYVGSFAVGDTVEPLVYQTSGSALTFAASAGGNWQAFGVTFLRAA